MTTRPSGDEPSLGGQPHDNAPMISGRSTKIMVSARGAYQTRNIRALIDLMTDDQRRIHKLAVHRQIFDLFRPYIEAEIEQGLHHSDFMRAIDRWLNDPSDAHRRRIKEVQQSSGESPGTPMYFHDLLGAMLDDRSSYYCNYILGVISAAFDWVDNYDAVYSALYARMENFHLEAAWAILHERAIPPFGGFDLEGDEP
jgi:hypothetical protein